MSEIALNQRGRTQEAPRGNEIIKVPKANSPMTPPKQLKRDTGNLETNVKAPKSRKKGLSLTTTLKLTPKFIKVVKGVTADLVPNLQTSIG